MKRLMKIKAAEFDKAFEEGDVSRFLDKKSLKVYNTIQRINVDIPKEMLLRVDHEATRIGVPRTSLIKMWIADRLAHSTA